MTPEQTQRRATLTSKIQTYRDELQQFADRERYGTVLTDGDQERVTRIQTALERAVDERRPLDQEYLNEVARGARPDQLETGDRGQDAAAHPRQRRDDAAPPHIREARDAGLRAIDQHRDALTGPAGDVLHALVRDPRDRYALAARYLRAVGSEAYLSAFAKVTADPVHGHLRFSPAEVEAMQDVDAIQAERAMAEGTTTAGGFAVPFELDPSVTQTSSGEINPLRAIGRQFTVTTNQWRGVSSDGVTASYDAEAEEVSDDTPTLAQPTINIASGRAFVPFSAELVMDWPGLTGELLRLISDARDQLDAAKFLSGTGTNEPCGLLSIGTAGALGTAQRVLTGGGTAALADLYSLKQAVPARAINNLSFVLHPDYYDTAFQYVAEADATNPKVIAEYGSGLFNRPTRFLSTMDSAGSTTGQQLIIGGDFREFRIADRLGLTAEPVNHVFGTAANRPPGERGLFVWWRTGTGVTAPNLFRHLEVS